MMGRTKQYAAGPYTLLHDAPEDENKKPETRRPPAVKNRSELGVEQVDAVDLEIEVRA